MIPAHSREREVALDAVRSAARLTRSVRASFTPDLAPEIDTVFLPTRANWGFISASLVREIASHGGDVSRYAPKAVCEALKAKFGQ